MFRIKDPKVSLPFYTDILGMELVHRMDAEEAKFTNYFLAFPDRSGGKPAHFDREGILELCHNWGTENESGAVYANGNSDPGKGFGHICVSVDDINKTCEYLEGKGVKFQKKLTDGRMKHIAFALDPDNYWIELVGNSKNR